MTMARRSPQEKKPLLRSSRSAALGTVHVMPPLSKRQQSINNLFAKVIQGKSLIALTEDAYVRNKINHVSQQHPVELTFSKSSNDLAMKLRDPKDQYDVLLIDLSKRELLVEKVLQSVRSHERYGLLPIIAVSAEPEEKL